MDLENGNGSIIINNIMYNYFLKLSFNSSLGFELKDSNLLTNIIYSLLKNQND